jgi:hypothetical protein
MVKPQRRSGASSFGFSPVRSDAAWPVGAAMASSSATLVPAQARIMRIDDAQQLIVHF